MDAPTPPQPADYANQGNDELCHETKVLQAIPGMAGGAGEFSYTRNSRVQSQVINLLKPILEQGIGELKIFHDWQAGSAVRMADFGCSTGANTLQYAEICFQTVQERCRVRASESGIWEAPVVQYFFCDLPSNDFNTLFRQLEDWRNSRTANSGAAHDGHVKNFYAAAVPGTFYRRLFPPRSLHVAISTFSVIWMSQVPDAVMDKASPAYNKGRVWIDRIQNSAVLDAFSQAAQQDLRKFLLARADELVSGGFLLFLAPGRADESRPNFERCGKSEYSGPFSSIVYEQTWQELVAEGIIDEETRDSFNLPVYMHSVEEARVAAESTNAFDIKRLEIRRVSQLPPEEAKRILAAPEEYGKFMCNFARALLLSLMVEHMGEQRTTEFFHRFEITAAAAAREKRILHLHMDVLLAVLVRR